MAEAFANAASGLFFIITEPEMIRESESRTLEIGEDNLADLLFSWLNGLIYLFDAEMFLGKRFDMTAFGRRRLKAVCYGEKYNASRHRLKTGIKAATYHQLKIDEKQNKLEVIFDV
jgi:SHS2 domain-containing protein